MPVYIEQFLLHLSDKFTKSHIQSMGDIYTTFVHQSAAVVHFVHQSAVLVHFVHQGAALVNLVHQSTALVPNSSASTVSSL